MPELLDEVDRGAEPDRLGDLGGAGLELAGQLGPGRARLEHLPDHVPAADERRHLLQQLAPPVQHADAGRARRPCGRSTRRSRRRSPAGRRGSAAPPGCRRSRPSAPAAWARRVISATGLIVPSTFETCATQTSLGLALEQPVVGVEVERAILQHRDVLERGATLERRSAATAPRRSGAPSRSPARRRRGSGSRGPRSARRG